MATGGYSTRNGSVMDYGSAYVDWVITAFMVIAGANFALHYSIIRGRWRGVLRSEELRVYAIALLLATAVTTASLWNGVAGVTGPGRYDSLVDAVRFASFQVASIITTTGFATADYEAWPALATGVLFALFFIGGMAGSTGGGVKVVRVVLILKNSFRELSQLLHPRAILPVRMDHRVVPEGVMRNVLSFVVLYVGLIGAGTLVMTALGLDLLSAFSASFSTVGNVGPAFGTLGPMENYAHVPALGKWVLAMLMMVGRLELFTVLLLFTPGFWRR
jgi:trk system potassium uptake protein TrkH